jgi:ligand-binding SRPBCC domain-containing protein
MTSVDLADPTADGTRATEGNPGRTFHFHASQRIARPLADVSEFFSEARNLERITPPWLRFEILGTEHGPLTEGSEIDYRLRIHGLPVRWRSRITCWEPPHRFVDEQQRGPYRRWVHLHTFQALPDGTTMIGDSVEYVVPGGFLFEGLLEKWFVRPDIERIFAWRKRRIVELLGGHQDS